MVSIGRYTVTMRESQGEYDGPFSTYPEWHAFLWGVGYMSTFVMALQIDRLVALPILVQIVRVSYFAMTGKRLDVQGHRAGFLPDRYLVQIRDESHYWWGGLSAVSVVAYAAGWVGYTDVVEPLTDFLPDVAAAPAAAVGWLRRGTSSPSTPGRSVGYIAGEGK